MEIISHPSPNYNQRANNRQPSLIIIHYTGMPSGKDALERLCDPASQVSAHYLIEEDGRIFQLVDDMMRAWHAGVSCWQGERDINSASIGIEIVNPGHEWGYREFPKKQLQALENLLQELQQRWHIKGENILGHSDVAFARKTDPGELFPWEDLAKKGFGLWPREKITPQDLSPLQAQELLKKIGYDAPLHGEMDALMKTLIANFQRHFRPSQITGELDSKTNGLIVSLAHGSTSSP
ncbi:MAG: N-acetylmuramoyl-L-alanine amidase [Dongiaceae bacterium]